jgi:hypothetical protein
MTDSFDVGFRPADQTQPVSLIIHSHLRRLITIANDLVIPQAGEVGNNPPACLTLPLEMPD